MDRDDIYKMVWDKFVEFSRLKTKDRTKWKILAVAGTPGSGKTRFIAEVLKKPHHSTVEHFNNYLYIHATYNNGNEVTPLDVRSPARSFALRLLFHYFIEEERFGSIRASRALYELDNKLQGEQVEISDALNLIRKHFIKSNHLADNAMVNIGLGIDEYNKLLVSDSPTSLKTIVEALGSTMLAPPEGVRLLLLFGGTSVDGITNAGLGSSFPVQTIRLPLLNHSSSLEIAEDVLQCVEVRTNPCFRNLILDIGGHPRLLESLLIDVKRYGSISDVNWTKVSQTLTQQLDTNLSALLQPPRMLEKVIMALFKREAVKPNMTIPGFNSLTYDWLEQQDIGLRFENDSIYWSHLCLQAWITAFRGENRSLFVSLVRTLRASSDDNDFFSWQHFERFCAQYIALKIAAFTETKEVTLKELLRGALFSPSKLLDDYLVNIPSADQYRGLVKTSTKTFPKKINLYDNGTEIQWRKTGQVVINNEGAPFDFFVNLDANYKNGLFICGQTKYYLHSTLTDAIIQMEYKKVHKAMKKSRFEHWILLIITTGKLRKYSVDLPERCVVVSADQFEAFFTKMFTERVHFWCKFLLDYFVCFFLTFEYAGTEKININTAPDWVLRRIEGIGEYKAHSILCKRQQEPFKNADDVRNRLKMGNGKLVSELLKAITF